jgi:hypothetical protein
MSNKNSEAFNVILQELLQFSADVLIDSFKANRPVSAPVMTERLIRVVKAKISKSAGLYLCTNLEIDGVDSLDTEIANFFYALKREGLLTPSKRNELLESFLKTIEDLENYWNEGD